MKVRASVKKMCADCTISRRPRTKKKRNGKKTKVWTVRVDCKNKRHKQRQG